QVYHMVADELNVSPSEICMVAAHVWDTIGAQSIGCSGALVARPGNAPLLLRGLPQPQVVAPDLPGGDADDQALALIKQPVKTMTRANVHQARMFETGTKRRLGNVRFCAAFGG